MLTKHELIKLRTDFSIVEIANKIGVSRATVCNWLKKYSISKPNKKVGEKIPQPYQIDMINGSLLGDATIDLRNGNSRFNKTQCVEHKTYLDWHFKTLMPFSLNIVNNYTNRIYKENNVIKIDKSVKILQYKFYTICHPYFTNLRSKWYINGKKRVPKDLDLNPYTIFCWYLDDGTSSKSRREVRFYTDGFLVEDVDLLISKMLAIGLKCTRRLHYNGWMISLLACSYDLFFDIIESFDKIKCFANTKLERR